MEVIMLKRYLKDKAGQNLSHLAKFAALLLIFGQNG